MLSTWLLDMKNKIYLVKIIECDSSYVVKAFLKLSSANEYANHLNSGFDALYHLEEERMGRVDDIMELVYDRNGYDDKPPFEAVDTWYANEKRKLNVPQECTHWDSLAMVEELELEDY